MFWEGFGSNSLHGTHAKLNFNSEYHVMVHGTTHSIGIHKSYIVSLLYMTDSYKTGRDWIWNIHSKVMQWRKQGVPIFMGVPKVLCHWNCNWQLLLVSCLQAYNGVWQGKKRSIRSVRHKVFNRIIHGAAHAEEINCTGQSPPCILQAQGLRIWVWSYAMLFFSLIVTSC